MSAAAVRHVHGAQQHFGTVGRPYYKLTFNMATLHRPPRSRLRVEAALGDVLNTVITWGALSLSVGATAYTLFYDWPKRGVDSRTAPLTQPEDNFTWGVMGVVSAIPLFNYMAWVFGALQSDNPRPYYWAAALYALPLLRNGLDQDWFSWTLLLLGVAHMQALRIAATEPATQADLRQQLQPLAIVAAVASSAGKAASAAVGPRQQQQQQQLGPGEDGNLISQVLKRDTDGEQDPEQLLRRLELDEFDRRLQEREQQQAGQQQQQQAGQQQAGQQRGSTRE